MVIARMSRQEARELAADYPDTLSIKGKGIKNSRRKMTGYLKKPHATLVGMRHGGMHLIMPIVKGLIDLPLVEAIKMPKLLLPCKGPVVTFWRDPRNVVVAGFRWARKRKDHRWNAIKDAGTEDEQIAAYMMWQKKNRGTYRDGLGVVGALSAFIQHWVQRDCGVVTHFETMNDPERGPAEAERISAHLGEPPGTGAALLAAVIGTGPTYTGEHSDWVKYFGPASRSQWRRAGGETLVEKLGYEPMSDG